jgi:hypothetical protein
VRSIKLVQPVLATPTIGLAGDHFSTTSRDVISEELWSLSDTERDTVARVARDLDVEEDLLRTGLTSPWRPPSPADSTLYAKPR